MIEGVLAHSGFEVTGFRTENDQIYVAYEPLFASSTFVKLEVKVEFGARSTGEQRQTLMPFCLQNSAILSSGMSIRALICLPC